MLDINQSPPPVLHQPLGHSETVRPDRFLTAQQVRVLDLMAAGMQNKEIAREMGISPRTIEIHRAKALRVIGAQSTIHACVLWDRVRRAHAGADVADLIAATMRLHALRAEAAARPVAMSTYDAAEKAIAEAALRAFPAAFPAGTH